MENEKIISDLSFTSLMPIIVITYSSLTLTLIYNSALLTLTITHISTKPLQLNSSLFLSTFLLCLFFSVSTPSFRLVLKFFFFLAQRRSIFKRSTLHTFSCRLHDLRSSGSKV